MAHEALIRNWTLLRQWLDECRDLLRQQRKIEDAAQEWLASGQKTDYLLSKKRLKEAKEFQKEQQEKYPLSQLATNFVDKSSKHQRRERTKSLGLFLIIPLIGTVIGGYFVVREIQLNSDQKLILDCEGKEYCPGRIEALERLVKAKRSLKLFNLSGANLFGADLSGADLFGANLSGADLNKALLIFANLNFTSLKSANLESTLLGGADLFIANLSDANLLGANLSDANLSGANLSDANLSGANLSDANLKNAYLISKNVNILITLPQIKSACYWEKAFYKGRYDDENYTWIIDEKANQEYIEELKKDKASDPKEPVDCRKWR